MQNIKTGKDEIIYLLTKAIEKYKAETGEEIIQNTNRKNYESLAMVLSNISNQLPVKYEEWGADFYSADANKLALNYPHRKYDITGGQIKDALTGIVAHPRPFIVDACYIYLYGVGRKAFKQNPTDENLIDNLPSSAAPNQVGEQLQNHILEQQIQLLQTKNRTFKKNLVALLLLLVLIAAGFIYAFVQYRQSNNSLAVLKKDLNILSYTPTQAEIDSLVGVWICYTGSPQARMSDPNRYHKVVNNLVEISYKNGYFIFTRYGASFDHTGYMQYEMPGIVSVFSKVKSNSGKNQSPRRSLLNLKSTKPYKNAISASWSFDVEENNRIIGIREVYKKLGVGGKLEEVLNEIENASCQCKIIRWHQNNKPTKTFYLRNELLHSLSEKELIPLINEKSILLNEPFDGLIISKDSM